MTFVELRLPVTSLQVDGEPDAAERTDRGTESPEGFVRAERGMTRRVDDSSGKRLGSPGRVEDLT
jgi:hypothetical protein